jgi:ubiquitin-like protein ATG12
MSEAAMSEATARPLPSWAAPDSSEINPEALAALETYKKRDPSKGRPTVA